ncbi:MAG: hypothetical protein PUP92_31010 [Rhizonema sp. PD38]|nr:hypothetical protein [Rhizonema sp. PD38]
MKGLVLTIYPNAKQRLFYRITFVYSQQGCLRQQGDTEARPIPRAAPVTTATLFCTRLLMMPPPLPLALLLWHSKHQARRDQPLMKGYGISSAITTDIK